MQAAGALKKGKARAAESIERARERKIAPKIGHTRRRAVASWWQGKNKKPSSWTICCRRRRPSI